jgi:hypothetical protein
MSTGFLSFSCDQPQPILSKGAHDLWSPLLITNKSGQQEKKGDGVGQCRKPGPVLRMIR